jgi:hypothetical protein
MKNFKIGDRVRYSSEFCRTVGASTGFTPQARGEIVKVWGGAGDFAKIKWDFPGPSGPYGCAHFNCLERCR